MTGMSILKQNRDLVLQIARQHGVATIRIFGSVARGQDRPDSDFDFLVVVGPNTSPWFPGGLVVELENLLGRPVQVVTEKGLSELLRDQILAEAIPI